MRSTCRAAPSLVRTWLGTRHADGASGYRPARVRLVDCDVGWPARYADEARLLTNTLGSYVLAIEHVGSTSVPGMGAKPTIDILAAVPIWDGFAVVVQRLAEIGYLYTPEAEVDDPGRRIFRKGPEDMGRLRTHHLHLTLVGSPYQQRIIAFRDHLRHHPDDAAAYARLKGELAATHADDSRGYTAGKHQFVTAIEHSAGIPQQAELRE